MDCKIKYKEYKISGSHSSVVEDPGILRCVFGQVIPDISKALQSCEFLGTTCSAIKHHILEDFDLSYKQISVWKCSWKKWLKSFKIGSCGSRISISAGERKTVLRI